MARNQRERGVRCGIHYFHRRWLYNLRSGDNVGVFPLARKQDDDVSGQFSYATP